MSRSRIERGREIALTILEFIHFTALCFTVWYVFKNGDNRAYRAAYAAVIYFVVAVWFVWPSQSPYAWFAITHGVMATIFLLFGTSRIGHWAVVLFCALFALDISALFGVVSQGAFPHILGAGYFIILGLVCGACHDRPNYRPIMGFSARAWWDFFRGGGGLYRRPVEAQKKTPSQ